MNCLTILSSVLAFSTLSSCSAEVPDTPAVSAEESVELAGSSGAAQPAEEATTGPGSVEAVPTEAKEDPAEELSQEPDSPQQDSPESDSQEAGVEEQSAGQQSDSAASEAPETPEIQLPEPIGTYTVLHEGLPLRESTMRNGRRIASLARGTELAVYGKRGSWIYAGVPEPAGLLGYVLIPSTPPGEAIDTGAYLRGAVTSQVSAGMVTKGVREQVLPIGDLSFEQAQADAGRLEGRSIAFEDFERFVSAGGLVSAMSGASVDLEDQPALEDTAAPAAVAPFLSEIRTYDHLVMARSKARLRFQISNDPHFFENNLPVEDEEAMGLTTALEVAGGRISDDEDLQQYVNLIGATLLEHTSRDDLQYSFTVIIDDAVNAFAAPGGYILITTGCIRACRNEAELAGVIAHEIAHVDLRHGLRLMDRNRDQIVKGMFGAELDDAIGREKAEAGRDRFRNIDFDKLTEGDLGKQEDGEDVVYRALRAASTANVEYFRKSWGRDFELEADALGVLLLAAAGWEWTAFKDFVSRLDEHPLDDHWASHPTREERTARVQETADQYGLDSTGVLATERFEEWTASGR